MKQHKVARRLAAAALSVSLLVPALAGCSKQGPEAKLDPQNPVVIEVWHYYNGPQKTAFDALVAEFNETVGREKGIVVESFNQGNVNELTQKVMDAAQKKVGAEDIPNIFAAYADTAYAIDKMGLAANLDQYLTDSEKKEYIASYLEEGRFSADGGLKIFPTAKSTEVLMINKTDWDKFAQATGASLDSLSTIEGVTATAKAYYEYTDSLTAAPDDGQ